MQDVAKKNRHLIEKMTACLEELKPYKVVLFGSYANGNPTEDSDLDVLVVLDSDKIVKTYREEMERWRPVAKAVREVHSQISMDIVVYSKAEVNRLRERGNRFITEVESTGKVLYER